MTKLNLVDRVKNILLVPRQEWPVIGQEQDSIAGLYTRYILLLSALPAVAGFIKFSLIGTSIPLTGVTVRVGVFSGLFSMLVQYGLGLLAVYLLAMIVEALAPTFGGQKNRVQALKVVAYAYTASWVASVAVILPWIGWLLSLAGGVYAIYLLYLGLPSTMHNPPERSLAYTVVTVVCAIVLGVVMALILSVFGGSPDLGSRTSDRGDDIQISTRDGSVSIDSDSALGHLGKMAQQMGAAGKKLEAAQQSGDTAAQQQALGEALGSMFGGDGNVKALEPAQIKAFVPESLEGLTRTNYQAERNTVMGLQVASAKGEYANDEGNATLRLEITDLGGASGLAMLAGWALVETESESDSGYERVREQDGMRVRERWDGSSRSGEYDLIVAERFMIKLRGQDLDMAQLHAAAEQLDLSGLRELKTAGAVAE